MTTGWYLVSSQ